MTGAGPEAPDPAGPDRAVDRVVLTMAPRADLVRAARLVTVAAARSSGVAEHVLDDIRLAVDEATGRVLHRTTEPVVITLDSSPTEFAVTVAATVHPGQETAPDLASALINGLAPTSEFSADGQVRMSWPLVVPAGL